MEASERHRTVISGSVAIAGNVLILASTACDWTRNKSFVQAIADAAPSGGVVIVSAAITSIMMTLLYFFNNKHDVALFIIQIIATSTMIFVFLTITAGYAGFFDLLEIGYFLCGLGLVILVLELVTRVIFVPAREMSRKNEMERPGAATQQDQPDHASMPMPSELEKKLYESLDHDIRRKILRMIGESGVGTFTEFKNTLGIGTGTLYHHLNSLAPLVFQKEDKKYYLTKLGEMTLQFMQDNLPFLGTIKQGDLEGKRAQKMQKYLSYLDTRPLLAKLFGGNPRYRALYLIMPLAIYIAGAFLGFQNYLYFFATYSFYGTPVLFTPLLQVPAFAMQAILSWLVMWVLIESLCYVNFKKRSDLAISLAGCGLSSIPILFYEIIIVIMKAFSVELSGFFSGFLLVAAQLVTVYFLLMFQM
jgi:hypothetical protein